MSSSTTPTGRQPKVMSNRLMTMKFMQRAVSNSSPQSSDSPVPTHISSKRQKLSHTASQGNDNPHAASPTAANHDAAAVRAAVAEEEAKRSAALNKLSVESGETKWAFSYFDTVEKPKPGRLNIVEFGNEGTVDADHSERSVHPWRTEQTEGRMKFGAWSNANGVANESSDSSGESDEDSDENQSALEKASAQSSENNVDTEAAERLRQKRKAKKKAEIEERDKLARLRKTREVNLNGRSQQSVSRTAHVATPKACYRCGEVGHLANQCPMAVASRQVGR